MPKLQLRAEIVCVHHSFTLAMQIMYKPSKCGMVVPILRLLWDVTRHDSRGFLNSVNHQSNPPPHRTLPNLLQSKTCNPLTIQPSTTHDKDHSRSTCKTAHKSSIDRKNQTKTTQTWKRVYVVTLTTKLIDRNRHWSIYSICSRREKNPCRLRLTGRE